MSTTKEFLNSNARILIGILWISIALMYVIDRLTNQLELRLVDWVGWVALFVAGVVSIINGILVKKKNQNRQ